MANKFKDYIRPKNRWMEGTQINFAIDTYSEVLQVAVDDTPALILNEDELREFIKSCEKSLEILRGK